MARKDEFLIEVNSLARIFPVDEFLDSLGRLRKKAWEPYDRGGEAFFTSELSPYTVSLYPNGSPPDSRLEIVGRDDHQHDIRSLGGTEFYMEACIVVRGPRVQSLYESLIRDRRA